MAAYITSMGFLSLGLVVLDEIRLPNQQPLTNILGGSAAYATLGARLFLPPTSSRSPGWMLHVGNDFPECTRGLLESWGVALVVDKEAERLSTRGLLEYRDTTFGPKTFRYTTTPLQVSIGSLENTPFLASKAFHFLESPQNINGRASELLASRSRSTDMLEPPLIIWEPAPLSCKAENLAPCLQALQSQTVDVFSPNHIELSALFGENPTSDKARIESLVLRIVASIDERRTSPPTFTPSEQEMKSLTILIRAGEHGCLVCTQNTKLTWLPPFYKLGLGGERNPKVVDPTGAGNAFLGGYASGYLRTGNPVDAACYGAVAASFALEQVGMPVLEKNVTRNGPGDEEVWNGESVLGRLREYRRGAGILRDKTEAMD
ncbi:Ribokinase-like protein [Aspergillus granulosus]|uniref:Ribokinase-like protein n=1 Tax=Aspergillus granulosus TaxID=176169 RepID=A0ABR4GXX4_9EURO